MTNAHACHACQKRREKRSGFNCPESARPFVEHASAGECPLLLFPSRGLGDTAAKVIHTATMGLIAPCDGCRGRKESLNRILPYK